jgi:hypothetical protein
LDKEELEREEELIEEYIYRFYDKSNKVLHWQLKIYDPQIIIFGNTFQHFERDLGVKKTDLLEDRYTIGVQYIIKSDKLYASAYHPIQSQLNQGDYVQGIINTVKMNIKNIVA